MMWEKIRQYFYLSGNMHLVMYIIMAGHLSSLATSVKLKEKYLTRLPLNDVLFTEDVLLEVWARSHIDCSKTCVETEGCAMCTFLSSPQGPPGHCRLHSQLQNLTDAWQNKTGAKSMAPSCEGGYTERCGRCLKAVSQNVTYTAAEEGCQQQSQGQLVILKTLAEVTCAHYFMMENGLYRSWIGASDIQKPGQFRWNDGTPLPDNSPLWNSVISDPDPEKENPGNDCVYMFADKIKIYDYICSAFHSYVCQKDLI